MKKTPPSPPPPPTNPLADQLKAVGFTATPAPPPVPAGEKPLDLSKSGKLVLRRERKGRGGKTVTVLSGLHLPPADLDRLARALRKGLGCGSTLEDGAVILQGDNIDRAKAWLLAHGAKTVVS